MKTMLAFVLLCGIGAQAQSCQRADLVFIPTRCPCTGSILFVDECQGTFGGQGCADAGGTDFCGPTCAILTGTGCIPGGPRLSLPLKSQSLSRDIRNLTLTKSQPTEQTCIYDEGAFK